MSFNASAVTHFSYPDLPEKTHSVYLSVFSRKPAMTDTESATVDFLESRHEDQLTLWATEPGWCFSSITNKTNLDGHLFTSNTDSSGGRFLTQIGFDKSWS